MSLSVSWVGVFPRNGDVIHKQIVRTVQMNKAVRGKMQQVKEHYRKVPKFSDTQNISYNQPEIQTKRVFHRKT